MVVLFLIYNIGFGNIAISSEQFETYSQCKKAYSIAYETLGDKILKGECIK